MKTRQKGISLLEAVLAMAAVAAVMAVAVSQARVAEDRSDALLATEMVRKLISVVQSDYGVAGPYPAGVVMAGYLARNPRIPSKPFTPATGCFAQSGALSLCISVVDDGVALGTTTGYGSFWTLSLTTLAAGKTTDACIKAAASARTSMIGARVGSQEPKDGAGQWLHGAEWDAWWRTRCAAPLSAEFTMR